MKENATKNFVKAPFPSHPEVLLRVLWRGIKSGVYALTFLLVVMALLIAWLGELSITEFWGLFVLLAIFFAPYIWVSCFSGFLYTGYDHSADTPRYGPGDWKVILLVAVIFCVLCIFAIGLHTVLSAIGLV